MMSTGSSTTTPFGQTNPVANLEDEVQQVSSTGKKRRQSRPSRAKPKEIMVDMTAQVYAEQEAKQQRRTPPIGAGSVLYRGLQSPAVAGLVRRPVPTTPLLLQLQPGSRPQAPSPATDPAQPPQPLPLPLSPVPLTPAAGTTHMQQQHQQAAGRGVACAAHRLPLHRLQPRSGRVNWPWWARQRCLRRHRP